MTQDSFRVSPRAGLAIAVGLVVLAYPGGASAAGSLSAGALAQRLAGGRRAVILDGVTVRGPLDLTDIGVVGVPFECRRCTFRGGIRAEHVVFRRDVFLAGTDVSGPLDLLAARFEQPLVLGPEGMRATRISGVADVRLATFDELADFQNTEFVRGALFPLARFRADALFTDALFKHAAIFGGAEFSGAAHFDIARFERSSDFAEASFTGGANFRLASFSGRSMFDRAEFGGRASFGQATFSAPGSFEAARFHDDASFLDATISGGLPGGDAGISFSHTVADKKLDLSGSTFISNTNLARLTDGQFVFGADLSELHAGQLRFDSATLQPGIRLRTQGLSVPDLRFKLSDFSHLSGPEEEAHIAGMVEGSAKTRGDLAIANDAHYKLRLLEARQETWPVYVLDFVFYRGVTGYFVRPLRPLLVLLALAVVIAVVAQLHRTRARQVRAWRARVLPWLASLANELLERLSLILPQFGARSSAPPTTGERIEAFTYRVLLVCALIGFANSNPTLRQMLDALR